MFEGGRKTLKAQRLRRIRKKYKEDDFGFAAESVLPCYANDNTPFPAIFACTKMTAIKTKATTKARATAIQARHKK